MKKSKYQQYFQCFIVYILVPYAFWLSYQQNMVTILLEGGTYFNVDTQSFGAYLRPGAY